MAGGAAIPHRAAHDHGVNESLLRELIPAVIGVLVRRGANFASTKSKHRNFSLSQPPNLILCPQATHSPCLNFTAISPRFETRPQFVFLRSHQNRPILPMTFKVFFSLPWIRRGVPGSTRIRFGIRTFCGK